MGASATKRVSQSATRSAADPVSDPNADAGTAAMPAYRGEVAPSAAVALADAEPAPATDGAGSPSRAERVGMAVLWLAGVIAIAMGAAGVLAGADHPAGTLARAELTWAADRRLTPALDAAARDLTALALDVDELGVAVRRVLVAVSDRDQKALNAAIVAGTAANASIGLGADTLRTRLAGLLGSDPHPELRISLTQITRHEVALGALDSTRGISDAWVRLTAAASAASRLAGLLADHDTTMGKAASQGRDQAYADAVVTIQSARAILDEATKLRDQLSATGSLVTLDQWLRRNRTYDDALEALYTAFTASGGKVTVEVSRAFEVQEAARAQLPPDTRGLVVIMAEISQGGLNEAAIVIDQAGQQLAHALEALPD